MPRSSIDGLRDRERLAVELLARGKTTREVSRTLNVSEKTIWNYRQKPRVQRAIFNLQQELMSTSGGQSINVVPDAITVLTEIMNDPNARATDRIAASRTLMNGANAFTERKVLERQLSDLEQQLINVLGTVTAPSAAVPPEDADADAALLMPSANPEDDE